MNYQIVISGVGGQGVLFVTRLLAQACMDRGEHVLTSETHGMAQRGGTVISHLKVGTFSSPLIRPGKADLLVALKPETFHQHRGFLSGSGKAIVNAGPGDPDLAGTVCIDAGTLPGQGAGPVNLFMLGGALAVCPVCPLDKVREQVVNKLARMDSQARDRAVKALEFGFSSVTEG
ncbi:MAG: 2-oxoacid:acceptor oxidoreductase family protein [Pseudomonadota bacterium]